jgi:Ca2+-binding EF-hand superfamily protein
MLSLLQAAFNELDENGNGYLEKEESMVFIKEYIIGKFFPNLKHDPEGVYQLIMQQVDADHDGRLNFEEFKHILVETNDPHAVHE